MYGGITDVAGIEVGHYTDVEHATGCTVVLCREGAVGGVDVRGSSPGTRETDLLRAESTVERVHAILLSGGSAFGLAAATGVVRYLEEQGIGHRVGSVIIPIVPAAILFDLGLVTPHVRPGEQEGYQACQDAHNGAVAEGSVGAGTGAVVGKALGHKYATKGGLGTAILDLGHGIVLGALVAVNAIGGVVDPETGVLIAGPSSPEGKGFQDSVALMATPSYRPPQEEQGLTNTTIAVVATTASLTKTQANKLAQVAHDGLALAIRPCHTLHDGDTMFALGTGRGGGNADMNRLAGVVSRVVAQAVVQAIKSAETVGGVPSWRELIGQG